MYPQTLHTGHHVIWSQSPNQRTTSLVVVLHDAGSQPQRAAETFFSMLPETTTGLAIQGGLTAANGHSWLSTNDYDNPNFPEIIAAAHRIFDAIDQDEFGTHDYTSIQIIGIGQGAAMATTMLRIRPDAITSIVGVDGYVLDNPMLAALDTSKDTKPSTPVLWVTTEDHPGAEFSANWLTMHTQVIDAETTSEITPFLRQKVS